MRSLHIGAILCLAIFTLAACDLGGGTTTVISGGSSTSATSTPLPTHTPAATSVPATCATILPGAGAATAGGGFSDVPFPSGSLSTAIIQHSSGTGQWTIFLFNVCSPSTSVGAIQSFFATDLPGNGWTQSPTLPFNGAYQDACGDAYCWGKGLAPRYVGLEKVMDAGNGNVTYRIRLFTPPPIPSCPVGPYAGPGGPFKPTLVAAPYNVPLPPFAEFGPASGFDQNNFAQTPGNVCSAGDLASLKAFYDFVMPYLGWAHGTPPTGCLLNAPVNDAWRKGTAYLNIDIGSTSSVSNGVQWSFELCTPLA